MKKLKTFWDYVAQDGLYQMGPNKYRNYILDRLRDLKVKNVLEVGCGTGPIYEMIKNTRTVENKKTWDFKYKGTDFAEEMVRVAKETFPEGNWEIEDARRLSEKDNSWECVLLVDCLDHLNDYQAAISEATRVSSKYVVISLWRDFMNEGVHLNDRNMMNKSPEEEPWEDTYLQEYSQEVLREEFKKNKLEIVEFTNGAEVNDDRHNRSLWILRK